MRLSKLVVCILTLASVAAAQSTTTPSQSGNQPDQSQSGATMSQPQTLQQKADTEQQNERKTQNGNFDVSGAATGQQDQELGEVRLMTRWSQVNGDAQGQARSFHLPGSNNLAEFNYFLDRRMFGTAYRYQFLTMFRGTDDTSIDPERNSVQKGYLRIYSQRQEFVFGDALVNYSRLTFNQNIKGVSTQTKLGQSWKLSTVGGVFIDRYGSLFKEQPLLDSAKCTSPLVPPPGYSADSQCGRPFTSGVAGARLEYALNRDAQIGFNFASSDDLTFTRRDQPFNTSPQPASNRVGSVDVKLQKGMFRWDSEFAYSGTNFDIRPGTCIAPCDSRMPTPGLGMQGDWGGRFDASYRYHKWTFRSSYVRYQPNFAAMNARQIADLQDFLFRASYDLTGFLTIDGTMRRNNGDLKGQLPFQTTIWGPEGRLMFHDLPFYRKAVIEIGYRHRIIDGFNAVAQYTTDSTGAKVITAGCVPQSSGGGMVCVDRFLRQPYAELTLPIKTTFVTVGYERRQSIDHLRASGTSNTDRIYGALRGIYDIGGWHINPSMRYEFERQNHQLDPDTFGGLPINQAQYLNPFQLLLLEHDNNRLATASMYIETPRWFILELQFRATTSTATTPGTLTQTCTAATTPPCKAGQTTITVSDPVAAGYSRPSYRANLTYKIANDENKVFIFSFERNSNFYFTSSDFDERLIGVTFVYKFGKRAR